MAERILWLSSQKMRYSSLLDSRSSDNGLDFCYCQTNDTSVNWGDLLAYPKEWMHAVVVITEPVLLMMHDYEYKRFLYELFDMLVNRGIKHSIMMKYDTYREKIDIQNRGYYYTYFYRKLYKLHQETLYNTIKSTDFYNIGELSYKEFITKYLELLVSKLHDQGCFEYAVRIAELADSFFDTKEKTLIQSPGSQLIYFDIDDGYSQTTEIQAILQQNKLAYKPGFQKSSLKHNEERDLSHLKNWRSVRDYLNRYGKNRLTNDSKETCVNTLSEKTFLALVNCLELELSAEEKDNCIKELIRIIRELKSWDGLNVVPYDDMTDFLDYLEEYVGDSRHIVFDKYILHDRLYAEEFDKFMLLFQEYVSVHKHIDIKFEKEQTDIGTIYVIKSYTPGIVRDNFVNLTDEFSAFMNDITFNSEQIDSIIAKYNLPLEKAEQIIQKYRRELHRMKTDMALDYAAKWLQYQRMFIDEVQEKSIIIHDQTYLKEQFALPSSVLSFDRIIIPDPHLQTLLEGDPNYGEIEKIIQKYIKKYGSNEKDRLLDALSITQDNRIDEKTKMKAKQKIKMFVKKIEPILEKDHIELGSEWQSQKRETNIQYTDELPF